MNESIIAQLQPHQKARYLDLLARWGEVKAQVFLTGCLTKEGACHDVEKPNFNRVKASKKRIVEFLAHRQMATSKEVGFALGIKESTAASHLYQLVQSGILIRGKERHYRSYQYRLRDKDVTLPQPRNLNDLIVDRLREYGPMERIQIEEKTGFTKLPILGHLKTLQSEGLVEKIPARKDTASGPCRTFIYALKK